MFLHGWLRRGPERDILDFRHGSLCEKFGVSLPVKGKKDLAQIKALTQAGLAAVRIDRVRSAMIDLVITAAGKLV